MAFMPHYAPLVFMGFLAASAALIGTGLVYVWSSWRRHPRARRGALLAALAIVGFYGLLLVGASLTSGDRVLAQGEKKYFCEIDCHEAYSIVEVRTTPTIGEGPAMQHARGTYYLVTVRVEFDANTIAPWRGREAPLYPNPRMVRLVDGEGREYPVDTEGQRALEAATGRHFIPFTQPIRPGESYADELVFDVPQGVESPRLYVTNGEGFPVPLLIGHERSPLHGRILFALDASS